MPSAKEETTADRKLRLMRELEELEQESADSGISIDAVQEALDKAQDAILHARSTGSAADMAKARKQLKKATELANKAEKEQAAASTKVDAIETEVAEEIERIKARAERKIRAAKTGVSLEAQMNHEKSESALDRLKAKGLAYPSYERGSGKIVVRLPMPWKEALLQEAKRRGCNQSDLMREGLKKVLDPQVAADLEDVYTGKRLS